MKRILFALLFISMALSQFTNDIAGWYGGAYYVPDGTLYSEGVTVVDEGTLAAESLNEVDFATHVKWDVTNDFVDSGGNAAYTWSLNQTSTLTQIQANLATAGVDAVWYLFTYTVAVTTAFDGDGVATITTGFASGAVTLSLSVGTHSVYFKSKTTPVDFVISIVSGTDTEGTFTIDDVTLKQITGGNVDIAGVLLVRGVDIGAGIGASTDDQKIDVFSISGDNVQLSLEDDGEATKTVDISTTTAVAANTAKITTQWTTDGNDIYYNTGKVGAGTPTPNAPLEVKGALPGNVGGFASGLFHITSSGVTQYSNSVITGHSAYSTNTQLWYLGSSSSSNDNITLINRQFGSLSIATNNLDRFIIESDGDIVLFNGTVGKDFTLTFDGETNDGVITYMEDEDRFDFDNSLKVGGLLTMSGGTPGVGKVLTDDGTGTGIATWTTPSAGGDFSDGGEAGGAARTLGNTDGYNMGFETNNIERAFFGATTGHFLPNGHYTYNLGASGSYWNNLYAGTAYIPTLQTDGLYHIGDADTKFVFDGADQAQIYAGGIKFMEYIEDANDRISIGTSSDINIFSHAYDYDYGLGLWTWKVSKAVLYSTNAHEQHTLTTVTYNVTETEFYSDRGNIQTMTFGAGDIATFDFNVPAQNNAMEFTLMMIQDGIGGRVVTTWDASIKWAGGTAPTLSAGADAIDILKFFYDGTNWHGWVAIANSQ